MIIGYDLDNTLWNLVENSLMYYNKDYEDNVKLNDLKEYDMSSNLKIPVDKFFNKYAQKPYINTLRVYNLTKASIEKDHKDGHKILFVTASYPNTIEWRDKKLKELFPWYQTNDLVVCHDKQLLKLDGLVDDCLSNLIDGDYVKFIVDMPWNRDVDDEELGLIRIKVE